MFETTLININFVLLFLLMLFYWLGTLDSLPRFMINWGQSGVLLSQTFQGGFLVFRWITSGHFPLSNLYESLLFLSWVLTVLLASINLFQTYDLTMKSQSNLPKELSRLLIGSIMMPIILLVNTFALFSLPTELKQTTALVPALQSNWLVMHVTVMILSYGTLIAGCLFSMAYLVVTLFTPNQPSLQSEGASIMSTYQPKESLSLEQETSDISLRLSPSSNQTYFAQLAALLDNLSYRVLGLGFPLLTIGLLSGSVWANQTWGSYWSWDPKETWALITWFIFAMYLHTRFSKGWNGRKSALLATFGFFILWVCYLGVNLMGKGLHSYGFLS